VHDNGQALVLSAEGELDVSTAQRLLLAVQDALRAAPVLLVIDLGGVEFVDSVGLAALVNTQRAAGATTLRFVTSTPPVRRALELVGLRDLLDTYPSLDEALAG
jgi:anti-anti-sigma factor